MNPSPLAAPLDLSPSAMPRGLVTPADARALIVIVHPDAASRRQPGQRFIADVLRAHQLATLSFSLRSPDDAATDRRIRRVLDWVSRQTPLRHRPIALIGVADAVPDCIAAAVRHGGAAIQTLALLNGRPNLARRDVARLRMPTLFVADARIPRLLASHRAAAKAMNAPHRLHVLAQATRPHTSAEVNEAVACAVTSWLVQTLPSTVPDAPAESCAERHATAPTRVAFGDHPR